MLNSIDEIIKIHKSEGYIEDAYKIINYRENFLKLNIYTLKFVSRK